MSESQQPVNAQTTEARRVDHVKVEGTCIGFGSGFLLWDGSNKPSVFKEKSEGT